MRIYQQSIYFLHHLFRSQIFRKKPTDFKGVIHLNNERFLSSSNVLVKGRPRKYRLYKFLKHKVSDICVTLTLKIIYCNNNFLSLPASCSYSSTCTFHLVLLWQIYVFYDLSCNQYIYILRYDQKHCYRMW